MPAEIKMAVSLTETGPFRRLIDFVEAVETHADTECDVALQALVHELRDDLLHMRR